MKKILLLTCLSFVFGILPSFAQYSAMSNYVQPAPNAAALGKYVDYPISYYTGTPDISVPLYNLKDGAAGVNVSLSYHPSGIRVSELASWVGLGWALNAGGMITRTIKGAPDEGSRISSSGTPRGYWADSGLTKLAHLPTTNNSTQSMVDSNINLGTNTIPQIIAGGSDGEPDIFTFNFGGYSGKFVFDEYRIPRLLSTQDIQISYTSVGGTGFTTWLFITPDGTKYYFGENSKYEVNSTNSVGALIDPNSTYPTTWLLTRVVYPNTKDTVNYNYTAESYSYFDLGQESKIYLPGGTNGTSTVNACAVSDYMDLPSIVYKTAVSGFRLSSIQSRNYNISFIGTIVRQDLTGTSYELDSVKIFNTGGQCIKGFLLSYGYFTSSTANNYSGTVSSKISDSTDSKRLKLLSVKEISGDGLSTKPAYVFNYQESQQLPRRLSYDQDHWGFSNNGGNKRFTPRVNHSICNSLTTSYTFAIRDPNWPAMQAFSIKSIKDPLGVVTNFEFEAHTTTQLYPIGTVGGLRIHKITTTDSVTGNVQTRLFNYGQGGILYRTPQYLYAPHNEYYFQGYSWPSINSTYKGYTYYDQDLLFLLKQSQSVVPLQDFQGNHIGYPIVKEIFGPNGEGGYKIYYFMADQNVRGSSRLDISNFTALGTVTNGPQGIQSGLYGNGKWNNIPPDSLVYYQGYNSNSYYPEAPPQVDFRRGRLMSEETYDSSNVMLKNVINTYSETISEKNWIRGFKAFRVTAANSQLNYDAMTFYKLHTGISHLISTQSTDYKDGKTMVSVTRYGYESAYHTQRTSDTTVNSIGDSLINKTYYSFDYTGTADTVFAKMIKRNMLIPVSSRTWKNNQLIGGSITKFADFASSSADTFINPIKMYALETSFPMTTVQANENIALAGRFNTLIPNSSFIEKADFNFNGTTGRVIEQHLINDKNQTMIWDNNARLPIAQVDNSYFNDIAYTSFETAETGNWTYTGTIVADTTAPTGTKAFTISSSISKSSLNTAQKYILSYWLKSGASVTVTGGTQTNNISGRILNGWTYHEVAITGTTSISMVGSGSIDEVRLHPILAQMTSYTYDALFRLVATCSANSTISYYQYDSFNRLVDIKDQYGNIIKAFEYNYGQLSR